MGEARSRETKGGSPEVREVLDVVDAFDVVLVELQLLQRCGLRL